jgi:hypothetical protein
MLAVNLDQMAAKLTQQTNACSLIIDENTRTAVTILHTAQNNIAVITDFIVFEEIAGGMVDTDIKHRRHLSLIRTMTHKGSIASGAKRQRQAVEQNRFTRTGFTGENRQSFLKLDIEFLNQDNIADRQLR